MKKLQAQLKVIVGENVILIKSIDERIKFNKRVSKDYINNSHLTTAVQYLKSLGLDGTLVSPEGNGHALVALTDTSCRELIDQSKEK